MFRYSLAATDSFGYSLLSPTYLGYATTSGLMFSELTPNGWDRVSEEKSKFVTLSPKQNLPVEVKYTDGNAGPSDFIEVHRPKTASFGSTLAVIDLSGTTTNRSFAFDEMPLTVVAGK